MCRFESWRSFFFFFFFLSKSKPAVTVSRLTSLTSDLRPSLGGPNQSSDTESLPSPHSSESSKAKDSGSDRFKSAPTTTSASGSSSDKDTPEEEKPQVKCEQGSVKQEERPEGTDGAKEVQGEVEDKKPPTLEVEELKREGRKREREHGGRDSDSSATCSADEVEETDNAEKNRCGCVSGGVCAR